jgi:hypothetical protein
MSGRPALARSRDIKASIQAARKSGLTQVIVKVGAAEVVIPLVPDDKPAEAFSAPAGLTLKVSDQVKKVWKHPDGRIRITTGTITAIQKNGDILVDQRNFACDGGRPFGPDDNGEIGDWEWQRWHIDHIEPLEGKDGA